MPNVTLEIPGTEAVVSYKASSPRNKRLFITAVVVVIVAIVFLAAIRKFFASGSGNTGNAARRTARAAQSLPYPTEDHPVLVRIGAEWSETLHNRHDAGIKADFHTPNLWWQVEVNGQEIYTLAPINYPESGNLQFKQVVFSVRYRVAPIDVCPENRGRKLEGELAYYYVPPR